jgi:hypothetical protein
VLAQEGDGEPLQTLVGGRFHSSNASVPPRGGRAT